MRTLLAPLVLGTVLACSPQPLRPARDRPAPARIEDVVERREGLELHDPYRWMENEPAALHRFLVDQNQATRALLDALPGRAALLSRLEQLQDGGERIVDLRLVAGKLFYVKQSPGAETRRLYARDGWGGRELLVLDPAALGQGGPIALDYFSPSDDGALVACGLSEGGSEATVLRVVETATGRLLPDRIDRAEGVGVAWRPDGRGFYYPRLWLLPPGAPPSDKYRRVRIHLHELGRAPERDPAVLGPDVAGDPGTAAFDQPSIQLAPGARWALASLNHGVRNELTLYVSARDALLAGRPVWQRLAAVEDEITDAALQGDDVFLISHRGAPRSRVLRVHSGGRTPPVLAQAAIAVPEQAGVVRALAPAADALFVQVLEGGPSRVLRVEQSGAPPREVALPFPGAVDLIAADPRHDGGAIGLSSLVHTPELYRVDSTGAAQTTALQRPWSDPLFNYSMDTALATSADGTRVPCTIVASRGSKRDGTSPALLEAYGSYGAVLEPFFRPEVVPWLEQGGIYSVAHVRGGGEFGEPWHLAGQKAHKQHTVDDLVACARLLISRGFTSPARLAGVGKSAGGITVGLALVQNPGLFAAVLDRVGVTNMVRAEQMPGGPSNIPEFGSADTPEGFRTLFAMDAYLHVRDGDPYPAVLISTGANDARVSSWMPAKMAARLQAATSSGRPVLLRVDFASGHGAGATRSQLAALRADEYAFLLWQLGDPRFQPGH